MLHLQFVYDYVVDVLRRADGLQWGEFATPELGFLGLFALGGDDLYIAHGHGHDRQWTVVARESMGAFPAPVPPVNLSPAVAPATQLGVSHSVAFRPETPPPPYTPHPAWPQDLPRQVEPTTTNKVPDSPPGAERSYDTDGHHTHVENSAAASSALRALVARKAIRRDPATGRFLSQTQQGALPSLPPGRINLRCLKTGAVVPPGTPQAVTYSALRGRQLVDPDTGLPAVGPGVRHAITRNVYRGRKYAAAKKARQCAKTDSAGDICQVGQASNANDA